MFPPFREDSPGGPSRAPRLCEPVRGSALLETEVACGLRPEYATYVNLNVTLGVAQCRAGKFKEALATLVHADEALCHEGLGNATQVAPRGAEGIDGSPSFRAIAVRGTS